MKRANFLEGSNGKLSATQLIFILVVFLGSSIDEIQAASQLASPSVTVTISGTPSMSGSSSGSISGSSLPTGSSSISGSSAATLSHSFTPPLTGSVTITVTKGLTPTASPVPTISATFGTSGTPTASYVPTLTASVLPSFTASLSVGASPSATPPAELLAGQSITAYNSYFCGNSVKEKQFGEQCDFGLGNVPKYTCCTPSCHWANGGRRCAARLSGCYSIGRCTGYSSCRGSRILPFGVGCQRRRGFCDGFGNCVAKSLYWYYYLRFRASGSPTKTKFMKKYLEKRKKYKNFNLADLHAASPERGFFDPNTTLLIDEEAEDGYFEGLEKVIEEERNIKKLDYDPLDDPEDVAETQLPLSEA